MVGAFRAAAFAVLYWLNPWRAYFSGFLWNPNYLFLFGAVHLCGLLGQRDRPRFWLSLRGSAWALAFRSTPRSCCSRWPRRCSGGAATSGRNGPAASSGAVLGAVPLMPWYLEVPAEPRDRHRGRQGVPRAAGCSSSSRCCAGCLYWLRYSSLLLADKMCAFDFSDLLGQPDSWLGPGLQGRPAWCCRSPWPCPCSPTAGCGGATARTSAAAPDGASRAGLAARLCDWCFAAALLVFCLSPTTLHEVAGGDPAPRRGARARALARCAGAQPAAWRPAGEGLVAGLRRGRGRPARGLAFGGPQYRCGGRLELRLPLARQPDVPGPGDPARLPQAAQPAGRLVAGCAPTGTRGLRRRPSRHVLPLPLCGRGRQRVRAQPRLRPPPPTVPRAGAWARAGDASTGAPRRPSCRAGRRRPHPGAGPTK